jgi:hypothetical protein
MMPVSFTTKQAYLTSTGPIPGSDVREGDMPDKSPHRQVTKKSDKSIKQKRAEKKSKHEVDTHVDPVAHIKKR